MILKVFDKQNLIAIIVPHHFKKKGIEFFTPDDFSQQLAYMNRPKGYKITPHVHLPVPRQVLYTRETLFIKSGKVKIDFYSEKKQYLKSVTVTAGDVIFIASGGHGFTMLEDSEMIEVKQGPYPGEEDKERFNAHEVK
jgi:mannose-6-phosphate isomerase-like protein (cupin superfamily)